jgi:elongation factor 1 alpha-like protein
VSGKRNLLLVLVNASSGADSEGKRGVTMDIAVQTLSTTHKNVTILDAPGHRDFIPNMISGASQADCALLVVGASTGEFEAGFDRGGQTREHIVLVRSLGVTQIVAAINKLDLVRFRFLRWVARRVHLWQVDWSKDRYEHICHQLKTFLVQSGFQTSKTHFVPVGAMSGVNLVSREGQDAVALNSWYSGPTLVELLGLLLPKHYRRPRESNLRTM